MNFTGGGSSAVGLPELDSPKHWTQVKHTMEIGHEIGIFRARVGSANTCFCEDVAEQAFQAGGWMAVQYWIRVTGWVLAFRHLVFSR